MLMKGEYLWVVYFYTFNDISFFQKSIFCETMSLLSVHVCVLCAHEAKVIGL